MTIDVKTGKPVIYTCPVCKSPTRGLINGHCFKCEAEMTAKPEPAEA